MKELWRGLGPLGPIALATSILPLIGLVTLIYHRVAIAEWLRDCGPNGRVIFVAAFALAAGLGLSPTHIPALMAGWVFRFPLGGLAAMCGVAGAALLGYVIGRLAAGDRLQRVLGSHPKAQLVYDALLNSGGVRRLTLVFLIRLASSPFALTTVVLAAARIGVVPYLLCTLLGMAPRTLAMSYVGSLLTRLDQDPTGPRWLKIVGIAAVLLSALLISSIAHRALHNVANSAPAAAGPPRREESSRDTAPGGGGDRP